MRIRIKSCAKANLYLRVDGINERSYHNITTFRCSIDIYDEVIMSLREDCKVFVEMDATIYQKNNATKVAEYLAKVYGIGANISIKKNIPIAAGLGGSSADTAAVIHGFNYLIKKVHDNKSVIESSFAEFGDDLPFMLGGGVDTGCDFDNAKALDALNKYVMVVVKPDFGLNTTEMFKRYDELKSLKSSKKHEVKDLCWALESLDEKKIKKNMINDLYKVAYDFNKEVEDIKRNIMKCGAISAVMSGSGSSFIGLFNALNKNIPFDLLKRKYEFVQVVRVPQKSIEILELDCER